MGGPAQERRDAWAQHVSTPSQRGNLCAGALVCSTRTQQTSWIKRKQFTPGHHNLLTQAHDTSAGVLDKPCCILAHWSLLSNANSSFSFFSAFWLRVLDKTCCFLAHWSLLSNANSSFSFFSAFWLRVLDKPCCIFAHWSLLSNANSSLQTQQLKQATEKSQLH